MSLQGNWFETRMLEKATMYRIPTSHDRVMGVPTTNRYSSTGQSLYSTSYRNKSHLISQEDSAEQLQNRMTFSRRKATAFNASPQLRKLPVVTLTADEDYSSDDSDTETETVVAETGPEDRTVGIKGAKLGALLQSLDIYPTLVPAFGVDSLQVVFGKNTGLTLPFSFLDPTVCAHEPSVTWKHMSKHSLYSVVCVDLGEWVDPRPDPAEQKDGKQKQAPPSAAAASQNTQNRRNQRSGRQNSTVHSHRQLPETLHWLVVNIRGDLGVEYGRVLAEYAGQFATPKIADTHTQYGMFLFKQGEEFDHKDWKEVSQRALPPPSPSDKAATLRFKQRGPELEDVVVQSVLVNRGGNPSERQNFSLVKFLDSFESRPVLVAAQTFVCEYNQEASQAVAQAFLGSGPELTPALTSDPFAYQRLA